MERGKFIVIYGINGVGKSTQIDILVNSLRKEGLNVNKIKYPIYDLAPEGPFINKYLRDLNFRKENELTTEELQKKYADNRFRYESTLKKRLESGEWIVAEDYVGTGITWGMTWGADLDYLEKINDGLLEADLSILLHGDRFETGIEGTHRNEQNDEKIKISKSFHFLLGQRYGWDSIEPNQKKEDVANDIMRIIKKKKLK
jgi:dTMP kinase